MLDPVASVISVVLTGNLVHNSMHIMQIAEIKKYTKKGHIWKMCWSSPTPMSQRTSTASALFDEPAIASTRTSLARSMT